MTYYLLEYTLPNDGRYVAVFQNKDLVKKVARHIVYVLRGEVEPIDEATEDTLIFPGFSLKEVLADNNGDL